jgi:hypothetical protein
MEGSVAGLNFIQKKSPGWPSSESVASTLGEMHAIGNRLPFECDPGCRFHLHVPQMSVISKIGCCEGIQNRRGPDSGSEVYVECDRKPSRSG